VPEVRGSGCRESEEQVKTQGQQEVQSPQQPRLLGWADVDEIRSAFEVAPEHWAGVEVLAAWSEYESYEGSAWVLFRRAGKLYEVNGGHCSCYGFEGQWEPSEVTTAEIEHRMTEGWTYHRVSSLYPAIREVLAEVSHAR
jgi:hypothetical protein